MRVLAVSPHLDDAAFSAGGLLAGLAGAGAEVEVVTVFTASVADPRGFALACQTDKGLGPEVDYLALRRDEDARAMSALGTRGRHLGLREAPHRGYDCAAALFGPVVAGDEDQPEVIARLLQDVLAEFPADLVLGPQALGEHVDHRHVRDGVRAALARRGEPVGFARWADTPYVLRPGAAPAAGTARHPTPVELDAKVAACAAYASQLGFQFGGVAAMAAALRPLPETFDPPLPAWAG